MPYIALKVLQAKGGGHHHPGDVVPEASTWHNPQPWITAGHVKFVSDAEVKDGRWMHYEAYAGAGAVRVPAKAPEPKVVKATHAPEPTEPPLDVGHEGEPAPMEHESTPASKKGKKGKSRGG